MIEPEEHVSPDGALILAVETLKGSDVAIGFRGFPWHTHADILASIRSCTEPHAVREFVDDVLHDRALIAIQSVDGDIRDAWVTDDPAKDRKYQQPNEQLGFRYWSGRQFVETD